MRSNLQTCPIWGTPLEGATTQLIESRSSITWGSYDSPRTGGGYHLAMDVSLNELSVEQRAKLTTWLVDQRSKGVHMPSITDAVVESVKARQPLQVHERATRLLRFIARQSQTVANRVWIDEGEYGAFAWSESTKWDEVDYFLEYLRERGWITGDFMSGGQGNVYVTVAGHAHIADQAANTDLTHGRTALDAWNSSVANEAEPSGNQIRQSRPMIMVIHGSSEGRVPQVVEDIRLWCFEHGVDAYKAADLPNSGRFVNDKVSSTINEADYYIVVLTADEELTTGAFRPRPNAMIEMGRVLDRDPKLVCVLKEDKVEMPSDYSSLITEPLANWRSILQRELGEVGLL